MNPEFPKAGRPRISAIARTVGLWLLAGLAYSIWFGSAVRPYVVVLDIIGCVSAIVIAFWRWRETGWTFGSWIVVGVCVVGALLMSQFIIPDRNGIWLDEGEYLRTLHHGFIVRDGVIPFNWRWLEPVLAGPLNVFPTSGADALKTCNFAALAVATVELVGVAHRLGVDRRLARLVPVFLLCSYLGTYAATNRLVVDPFNYAAFVLILHALAADRDQLLRSFLLVAAFNSEKVIYWIPVIVVSKWFRNKHPGAVQLQRALLRTLGICLPVLVYFAILLLATSGASRDTSGTFVEQLHRLAITWVSPKVEDPVAVATMPQMLWFPFGAFTIYALLGLRLVERWLAAMFLLLVPLMGQVLIAHDSERMVAYCFIVYIPLGCVYLTSVLSDLPKSLALATLVVITVLPLAQVYLLPICRLLSDRGYHFVHIVLHVQRELKLWLEAAELLVVGGLLWIHLAVFAPRAASGGGKSALPTSAPSS